MEKLPRDKDSKFNFRVNEEFNPVDKYSKPYDVHGTSEYGARKSIPKIDNTYSAENYAKKNKLLSDLRDSQIAIASTGAKNPTEAAMVNAVDDKFRWEGYERTPRNEVIKELSSKSGRKELGATQKYKEVIAKMRNLPESPVSGFSYVKKLGGKIFKVIPAIGAVATGLGALGYSDQAGAAVDMATGPLGGVEEMGVSPEQKDLDIQYLNRIRQLNQRKK